MPGINDFKISNELQAVLLRENISCQTEISRSKDTLGDLIITLRKYKDGILLYQCIESITAWQMIMLRHPKVFIEELIMSMVQKIKEATDETDKSI